MDTLKNVGNQVSETVQGATSTASKEGNKGKASCIVPQNALSDYAFLEVAKDSNADIGTRATAAKDAVGDKVDEKKHDTSADLHKEQAKH
ncbi:MAG: hypothetical protein Q9181_001695 [Wetmoreana brouardii]